jgi:DNA-3-methyladenine glycosylase
MRGVSRARRGSTRDPGTRDGNLRGGTVLPKSFYAREDVLAVARDLLGCVLVVPDRLGRRVSGIIVETEAYRGPEDRASHAFGGRRTARTETMYGAGGTAYVYFVYGMYHQFNVVTNAVDVPHAILVRALGPLEGIERMARRRGRRDVEHLASGPGKLCIALGIGRGLDRADLAGPRVWIERGPRIAPSEIARGPRVGIDYAGAWARKPWRYWIRGHPCVSRV